MANEKDFGDFDRFSVSLRAYSRNLITMKVTVVAALTFASAVQAHCMSLGTSPRAVANPK